MNSSRRAAREWALKTLYSMDVGRSPLSESLESGLERLRREFVLRGSRTASGSPAEQACLEQITSNLRDLLPGLRLPMERTLTFAIPRLFKEIPYALEVRFEKSFRNQAPGVLLSPARLSSPMPDREYFPEPETKDDGLARSFARLTPEEIRLYRHFVVNEREDLPLLLDKELRKTGLSYARQIAGSRPLGVTPSELHHYLCEHREEMVETSAERWRKVGQMVQKQTGDWLRTAAFTHKLVIGVGEHHIEIDKEIKKLASGWSSDRQAAVDRNILRIAVYEMIHLPSIPSAASINEAVELAKKYSTTESSRFVNGVLGALANRVGDKVSTNRQAEDALESAQDTPIDLPDIEEMAENDEIEVANEDGGQE